MARRSRPKLPGAHRVRYEYRVWGRQSKARKTLRKLSDSSTEEQVEDCYLITDDPTWNVKIRGRSLKLKRLITSDKGFERWAAGRYRREGDTPHPFDELFAALRLDRLVAGKPHDLRKALKKHGDDLGVRAVYVTKHRQRYTVEGMRAEVTDIEVEDGDTLRTLVIEGEDLDALRDLRKKLGLRGEPNVAVHEVLDEEE